jgi:hypothetical protein
MMRRARVVALVAVPVLLLGAGCRGGGGAGGADTGSDTGSDPGAVTGPATGSPDEPGGGSGGIEQDFEDIESTLDSIESEIAQDGR